MLVLTRKAGETIKIGDDIELTILSTKGDQIKIGVKAPKHIEIYRKELLEEILDENLQAAAVKADLISLLRKKN